jgi:hypothetical protein
VAGPGRELPSSPDHTRSSAARRPRLQTLRGGCARGGRHGRRRSACRRTSRAPTVGAERRMSAAGCTSARIRNSRDWNRCMAPSRSVPNAIWTPARCASSSTCSPGSGRRRLWRDWSRASRSRDRAPPAPTTSPGLGRNSLEEEWRNARVHQVAILDRPHDAAQTAFDRA